MESRNGPVTLPADFAWAVGRFLKKWSVGALPASAHLRIAAARGRIQHAIRGAPPHVRANIESALPDLAPEELERLANRLCEFAHRMYLWRVLPCLPGASRPGRWPITGREHLDDALEGGKGVVLVSAHYGYSQIIPHALAAHGYPAARIAAELEHREEVERTERWLASGSWIRRFAYERTRVQTDRLGAEDIYAGLDVRPVFDRLSKNGILLTTIDGLRAMQFVDLPLFGAPYPLPTGAMRIAMTSGAAVVPIFATQKGRAGAITLEIGSILPVDPDADIEENMMLMARALEAQIRRVPELWYRWLIADWFQVARRWSRGDRSSRYTTQLT